MDRKQFIEELKERLMCLPYDERDKAISFYEEYFDDAGVENEDKVISGLGDVEKIAKEIIENSSSTIDAVSKNKFSEEKIINSSSIEIKNQNIQSYSNNSGTHNSSYTNNSGTSNNGKYKYSYSKTFDFDSKVKGKNKTLWILLAIVGAIAVLPVVAGLIGLVFGLIGLIIGLVFSSIGFAFSLIFGIVSLPITGLALVGKILFSLGKGILGIAALVFIVVAAVYLIKKLYVYFQNR